MKPFRKSPEQKILTVTIDENGDVVYLKTEASDVLLELGETVTRRASHVEPDNVLLRVAFHTLRLFGDKTSLAEWTRGWQILWRVNTRPVGGPVLPGRWTDRQAAIAAEIEFLNTYFLERGIQ